MGLPAVQQQEPQMSPAEDRRREAYVEAIAHGLRPPEIAKRVFPDDPKKRQGLRQKLWRMLHSDVDFQARIAARTVAEGYLGLVPAMQGTVRRAASGRPDGARLLMEAVGFHNPRVQHEHSGEVTIKMEMPRPKAIEEEPVDAEVVE